MTQWTSERIAENLKKFLDERRPDKRYASFDYCFNYFQGFRERGRVAELANSENLQESCLQLGFYLASWGMYRGSSFLLRDTSAKYFEPLIKVIAGVEHDAWGIDVGDYSDDDKRNRVMSLYGEIARVLSRPSRTLVTKIMLGVFGCVPALDQFVSSAFGVSTLNDKGLKKIHEFYLSWKPVIDAQRVLTIDFLSGANTQRLYSKAKVIDMVGFIEGLSASKKRSAN